MAQAAKKKSAATKSTARAKTLNAVPKMTKAEREKREAVLQYKRDYHARKKAERELAERKGKRASASKSETTSAPAVSLASTQPTFIAALEVLRDVALASGDSAKAEAIALAIRMSQQKV